MILKPFRTDMSNHSYSAISVERVKEQIRLLDNDEDQLLARYVRSAVDDIEEWSGYYLFPATFTAYFDFCSQCITQYYLDKRPFYELSKVEVKKDGNYVELTSADYFLMRHKWYQMIQLKTTVDVDESDQFEPDMIVVDPVKITYETGTRNVIAITQIETTIVSTENTATVTTALPHNLKNNDQVVISETGADDYNGTFTITKISSTKFSFQYLGTDPGIKNTGSCLIPILDPELELAILQMVADMYTNRGDCSDECGKIPCMAQSLASHHRRMNVRVGNLRSECDCQ